MGPILPLDIRLPPEGSRDLLRALHRQLRAAILDGRLQPGLRLPATRALADGLGVSRNTAVAAYDLLLSEGYLAARPGAGTYVADVVRRPRRAEPADSTGADRRLSVPWRTPPVVPPPTSPPTYRFDLRVGLPDTSGFPFHVWRRLSARALRTVAKVPAAYADPQGRRALRAAIAQHVSFARAVACQPDDIVVTSGAQQAFDLLARILVAPGRTVVAIEEPGYPPLRAAFAAAGARIAPVAVDGEGLMVDRVPRDVRVICVTPSHQYPTGVVMSPQRRAALLDAAQARAAVVIEDDYDSEFRFAGRPLDALQTLDRTGCVFYVGTFSKSLFPALRLGFVAAPPWARQALVTAKQTADWHAPVLAQDTLAAFITEGHLARHVRKMRKIYDERRAILLRALQRHWGERLQPIPSDAGLHLSARLPAAIPAEPLVAKAAQAGIGLYALAGRTTLRPRPNGLIFGYGMIAAGRIDEAIRQLARLAS